MFSASFKITSRNTSQKGIISIYLRIRIEGQKLDKSLKIKWSSKYFHEKTGKLKPRFKNDNDCTKYNSIIHQQSTKANQIISDYLLMQKPLTIEIFKREFAKNYNRKNFIAFMSDEIKRRHKLGDIGDRTRNMCEVALSHLREYQKIISFADLSLEFIQGLESNMRKSLGMNSRAMYHAKIKCYINIAIKQNLIETSPYTNFKIEEEGGKLTPLTQAELKQLIEIDRANLPNKLNKPLDMFLFSCLTGLRISDVFTASHDNIINGILCYYPVKNFVKRPKLVKVPLHDQALKFIHSEEGLFFPHPESEPSINRKLKLIMEWAGIDKNISFHSARATFCTVLGELTGGDVLAVKELAGHSKLKTTMRYIKLSNQHKRKQIGKFDDLF